MSFDKEKTIKPEKTSEQYSPEILELSEKLHLQQQWENQVRALNETGVIELLPKLQDIGIIDINGEEQPIPMYEDILDALKDKAIFETIKNKSEQYENPKLLLVPVGLPISILIDRYKKLIIKKEQEGNLKSTDNTTLPLDKENPIYRESPFDQANVEDKLVYFPSQFDKNNHKGKTKQELIQQQGAWQVVLIEDIDIPAEGKGKNVEGRKQIEANQSSEQYLKALQTDPQYQNEQAPTIESELTYAITKLQAENKQIDDYQGKGKVSWLFGNYLPEESSSGGVPRFYWDRGNRQAFLYWSNPGNRYDNHGARLGVRIFSKKRP